MKKYEDSEMVNQIHDVPGSKLINVKENSNSGKGVHPEQPETATSSSSQDSVKLSPTAQQLDTLKELISAAPDVDQAKVDAIKAALDAGELNIDANALAKKMLELESM